MGNHYGDRAGLGDGGHAGGHECGGPDGAADASGALSGPGREPTGRFAVIGSGIAGLTAAYVLRTTGEVTLYEADHRLGGHAHTHEVTGSDGRPLAVDSGFIVYNERTYPLLTRLFGELGVSTRETEMSMSVRCDGCALEYAGGRGPGGLFAAPGTAARPAYLRMLGAVPRFHRAAHELLAGDSDITLGRFLREREFSPHFAQHFVLPLVSTVWSCPGVLATHYPARHLFRFLANHGMLTVSGSPRWRTVLGGSRSTGATTATARLRAWWPRCTTPTAAGTRTYFAPTAGEEPWPKSSSTSRRSSPSRAAIG